MYLYGSFVTQRKERATVEIVTHNDRATSLEIGNGSGIYFTADPVEIRSEVNDSFDPLFRSSASVRLLTRDIIPDLFCANVLDAVVNITLDGKCVFAGFLTPRTYSQPYARSYDELELNCIDAISALQFSKYRDIGSLGIDYAAVRESSSIRSFQSVLTDIFGKVTKDLDLSGQERCRILYDCSITLGNGHHLFTDIGLSELLFLGEEEDEVWSKLDVAEEIMRYLNLHMVQDGMDFKIYSLDNVKGDSEEIGWKTLTGTQVTGNIRQDVVITTGVAMGTDANISFGEVYNRLELTCEVTEVSEVVESPLNESSVTSPFTNRQKYLTEYVSPFEKRKGDAIDGATSAVDFLNLFTGEKTTGQAFIRDWYMQVEDHLNWKFYDGGNGIDVIATYCTSNSNQQTVPNLMYNNPVAALLSFGSVKKVMDEKDNSLTPKINMETSLVVSVCGNGKDSAAETYPTEATLLNSSPLAVYTGATSGGVFSPADYDTTNYIVISGEIVLNPLLKVTCMYANHPEEFSDVSNFQTLKITPVPTGSGDDKRFYCPQWWKANTPSSIPVYDAGRTGIVPYTGDGPQEYEFKYSAVGNATDTISKVGVLACMLVIGNKCLVESGTQGRVTDFEWKPFKERVQCLTDDEYYSQCFTLGFDPKIGDRLVGTLFPIQNNISYELGIDAEGTAIPVRKGDKLSGKVRFMILGPVNTTWGEVTRRHPTWFRHTQWGQNDIPLMAHVSNIFIKGFEMKIYSDNGHVNNGDNCNLVYMSDTAEEFCNKKDDLKFRITTALTKDERIELGISNALNISSPVVLSTGESLLTVKNDVREETGKPEKLYVDSYYREYHKPRICLVHRLRSNCGAIGLFNRYAHPALPGKKFFVLGISRGLMEGWAELTLKEIEAS